MQTLPLHTYLLFMLTSYLEGIVSNHVSRIYVVGWSEALNQCTIQYRSCSATEC